MVSAVIRQVAFVLLIICDRLNRLILRSCSSSNNMFRSETESNTMRLAPNFEMKSGSSLLILDMVVLASLGSELHDHHLLRVDQRLKVPSMRLRILDDRVLVLFQRDVDALLSVRQPLIQELQSESRLSRTERSMTTNVCDFGTPPSRSSSKPSIPVFTRSIFSPNPFRINDH